MKNIDGYFIAKLDPYQIVPDGEAVVVVVAGQVFGPLVQLVQVVRLVQLPIRLHIPFDESKVKSVHDGSPAHKT